MKISIFSILLVAFVVCKSVGLAQEAPKNYSYAGPYKGADDKLTAEDLARDVNAATQFIKDKYPRKFVTVFGSSRIADPKHEAGLPSPIVQENRALYRDVYELANRWQKKHGEKIPIMTGAGPGVMKAASEGAKDAGVGKSIGYTTYYGSARDDSGGKPEKAFVTGSPGADGKPKQLIDDGLIFSSVALREFFMLVHSRAMIFAPGGTGTEWEIFEAIEMIKSDQLTPVSIIFIGNKEKHWSSFYDRIRSMHARGMIKEHEVIDHIQHADNANEVIDILEKALAKDLAS